MSSTEITIDHTVGNVRAVATIRFEGSDDMASALAEKWAAEVGDWREEQEIRCESPRLERVDLAWGEV